ncbi:MAG: hypothetical protein RR595_16300, partial [Lysinibacillus sp.]
AWEMGIRHHAAVVSVLLGREWEASGPMQLEMLLATAQYLQQVVRERSKILSLITRPEVTRLMLR